MLRRRGHVGALEHVPLRLALAPGAAAAEPVGDGHAVLQHPQRGERRRATRALDRRRGPRARPPPAAPGSAASASAARARRRPRPRSARASRARRRGRRSGPRWTNQCSLDLGAPAPVGARRAPCPRRTGSSRGRGPLSDSPIRRCSRASGFGAHQFQSPSSRISDGTSSARTIVASISTASAVPTPSCLMKMICEVANAPIAITNSSAANVTIRPGALEPERDRLLVGRAGVVRLLDAREQEHAVVGREPERDREQQHRLARLQRALAREAEQPLAGGRPGRSARAGRTRRSASAGSSPAPSPAGSPTPSSGTG